MSGRFPPWKGLGSLIGSSLRLTTSLDSEVSSLIQTVYGVSPSWSMLLVVPLGSFGSSWLVISQIDIPESPIFPDLGWYLPSSSESPESSDDSNTHLIVLSLVFRGVGWYRMGSFA